MRCLERRVQSFASGPRELWFGALVVGACLLVLPASAVAQNPPARYEVGFGGLWVGSASLGEMDANATTAQGGTLRLFSTRSEVTSLPAIDGRVGVRLSRALSTEASVSYGASELSTDVRSDVEGAADAIVTEPIRQFAIEASIVAELTGWRLGSRTLPFVTAGAGYMRQLHEANTLVESGAIYRVGGGLNYILRGPRPGTKPGMRPLLKTIGLRADLRTVIRTGGVALAQATNVAPGFGASVFFRF